MARPGRSIRRRRPELQLAAGELDMPNFVLSLKSGDFDHSIKPRKSDADNEMLVCPKLNIGFRQARSILDCLQSVEGVVSWELRAMESS